MTGFGNPDWSRTHEPASQTSTVVTTLVEGGATCTGRTVVDDMAFGFVPDSFHWLKLELFSKIGRILDFLILWLVMISISVVLHISMLQFGILIVMLIILVIFTVQY